MCVQARVYYTMFHQNFGLYVPCLDEHIELDDSGNTIGASWESLYSRHYILNTWQYHDVWKGYWIGNIMQRQRHIGTRSEMCGAQPI